MVMVTEVINDMCIITPDYRQIDATNADSFGTQLSYELDRNCPIIVDLKNLFFIDSSGLKGIIDAVKKANDNDKSLVFCNTSDAMKDLFSIVNLSQIAVFMDTLEGAIERNLQIN